MRMPDASPVDALRTAVGFTPRGESTGNLTIGDGTLDGNPLRVALVENRIASGSIGKAEAARLASLFSIAAHERSALVIYLDSAGARVSEGLDALGAFRGLFAQALAARAAGARIAAVLGRNCYGGASMLAHIGAQRLFSPSTRLAMSGPAILALASGASALDGMFAAMADASIGASARAKACGANSVFGPDTDLAAWLRSALAPGPDAWNAYRDRHVELRDRMGAAPPAPAPERVRRKDLDRLFATGYDAVESDGVIAGRIARDGGEVPLLGLVGATPVGAGRAWRFAEEAWNLADRAPPRIEVLLDCESHAARLEDERLLLTEYVVDMGVSLGAARSRGTHVELTILGRAGGGVYVALASAASRVAVVIGAEIQVLPGAAVASILGSRDDAIGDIAEYVRAGVADVEHKLGLPAALLP